MCHLDWAMWCPDSWLIIISGYVRDSVWIKLTVESTDWVRQIVSPPHAQPPDWEASILWRLEQNKNRLRETSFSGFELNIGFLHSDWNLHRRSPSSQALRTRNYTTYSLGTLPCRWQILGFLNLHSHVSQFLIINLFIDQLCVCVCFQSCPTLLWPHDYSPPRSSVREIFPGKNTGVGCHCLVKEVAISSFQAQGSNPCAPVSPALAGGFFIIEPPGKPNSIGSASLENPHTAHDKLQPSDSLLPPDPKPHTPHTEGIVITNLPGGSSLALSGSDQERKCIVGQDGTWRRSQGPAGIDCIICALSFVTHSETPGTGSQGRVRIWRAGETLPCGIL